MPAETTMATSSSPVSTARAASGFGRRRVGVAACMRSVQLRKVNSKSRSLACARDDKTKSRSLACARDDKTKSRSLATLVMTKTKNKDKQKQKTTTVLLGPVAPGLRGRRRLPVPGPGDDRRRA